ncbi:MAG TPA: hypothetical protein VMS17_08440, partial [Gemmataceae bacterium]|nr:hypothetical protein [Gemmataceae bacterium]
MALVNMALVMALLGSRVFIHACVSELGAQDFNRRELASSLLFQLGPFAYPQLRHAAEDCDPEVRHRAEAIIKRLQLKALRGAAERQVEMKPTRDGFQHHRCFGTLLQGDGKTGYILTADMKAALLRDTGLVEWHGKHYPAHLVKADEDLDLALFSFPCNADLTPLPIAGPRTFGLWWNYHTDLSACFQQNMDLLDANGDGAGVFAFDEDSVGLALAGVDSGGYLETVTYT